MSTLGEVASQRASATFCWLPPESDSTSDVDRGGLDSELLDVALRLTALAGAIDQPAPRDSRQTREADVFFHRHLRHDAVLLAVLGKIGDAGVDGCGGRVRARSAGRARARRRNRLASARTPSAPVRCGPIRRGRRDRQSRRCRTASDTSRTPAASHVRFRSSSATDPSVTGRFGKIADSSRPIIRLISVEPCRPSRACVPTVLPSRSTVTRSAIARISSRRCEM